jgi:plasmid maintenance system antidote protein VapI
MSATRQGDGKPRRVISLADQLRQAAADSGLSVYRIAKETGVDQSTLNKFLTGARDNLRLDVADRLFRFFFHPPCRKRRRSAGKRP